MEIKAKLVGIVTITTLLFLSSTMAQQEQSRIIRLRDLQLQHVRSPDYRAGGALTAGFKKKWLQLSAEYDTAPAWIDELELIYYVLFRDGSQRILFSGTMKYINIQKGKGHKSVMYMHPSSAERYGEVAAVALIIKHEGRVEVAGTEPRTNRRWWEESTPRSGYLLSRLETPFAMLRFDDYEAIKPSL